MENDGNNKNFVIIFPFILDNGFGICGTENVGISFSGVTVPMIHQTHLEINGI